jgi:hypothetical protein
LLSCIGTGEGEMRVVQHDFFATCFAKHAAPKLRGFAECKRRAFFKAEV